MLKHLITLHQSNRLPHGIVWASENTDELTTFISFLLCQDTNKKTRACEQCKACVLRRSEAGHPDLYWIKPEGKLNIIKIDQVRELITSLSNSAQQGGYKITVFEQADNLNIASQNALLKSLEEPSSSSLLILQTARPHLLLPTIKSRCQIFTSNTQDQNPDKKTVEEFIDALSFNFKPIEVAAKFKDAPLEALFNGWYEFLYEIIRAQQGLSISQAWHSWRNNIEEAAKKSTEKLYKFIDELMQLKNLTYKKVALNQQALLERALIEWQRT